MRHTSARDETVARSVLRPAGSGPTRQSVGLHSGAVQVAAVSVGVARGRVDRPVSTVPDIIDVDASDVLQLDSQARVESDLPLLGGGGGGEMRPVWIMVFLWSEDRRLHS